MRNQISRQLRVPQESVPSVGKKQRNSSSAYSRREINWHEIEDQLTREDNQTDIKKVLRHNRDKGTKQIKAESVNR